MYATEDSHIIATLLSGREMRPALCIMTKRWHVMNSHVILLPPVPFRACVRNSETLVP
jgi:hypothetical protein